MIRSLLRKKLPASRLALTIGLGGSLLALNGAQAQEVSNPTTSTAPETAPVERVVVTGSNIPSAEEVGAVPVDTLDQAARDRTGQEDVLSTLQRSIPAISGGGNIGQSNGSINANNTLGASQITIHGLPTLVLLDGRRVTSASAAAQGGVTGADLNLFPTALVKRIEVLKDGAAAIYGSDAIGGVVNVILDQEFTGFDFSARYGFAEAGDIHDQRYSGVVGLGDDKTKIVLGVQYTQQDPIFNRQRDYAGPSFGTTTYGGIIRLGANLSGTGLATAPYVLNPALNSPTDVNPANPGVATPLTGLAAGTYTRSTTLAVTDGFDLSKATSVTIDQNRLDFIGTFERQLFGKYLVAFGDVLYASVYSQSQLNAQPLSNATGVVIPATAPYNPFGTTIDATTTAGANAIQVNNRFTAFPRVARTDTNFYRVVAGVKGEVVKDLTYEIALNSSQDRSNFKQFNLVLGSSLNAAVAGGFDAAGNPLTGGTFSVVGGNVQPALNFFARNNPASAFNGVFGTDNRELTTKLYGIDGKLNYFLPFNLPAGPIGLAAGGEWRHEELRAIFSPEIFLGSVPGADINAGRDVRAGFAEISIPVVSPTMKIFGVYEAEIDAAVRYEHYSDAGDSTVPKVSFVYRPIQDIALRGSYSQSFVAPTLYEEFGPRTQGFSSSVDLGAGPEQAQEITGSTPNLAPSEADTYSAGIVISPHQVKGLTLNLDFFHVDQNNIVGVPPDSTILTDVNAKGAASQYAGLVALGNFPGQPGATPITAPGQLAGNLTDAFVITTNQNIGGVRVGGVDFGASYTADLKKFGELSLGCNGVYYFQFKQQVVATQPFYDTVGFYQGLANAVPDYHLIPFVTYSAYGFSFSALMNYSPSLRDAHNIDLTTYQGPAKDGYLPKIRDYYTVDLRVGYEFGLNKPVDEAPVPAPKDGKDKGKNVAYNDGKDGKATPTSQTMAKQMSIARYLDGLKLEFGVNNVTNARPPLIEASPDATNSDGALYDPYQRYYYFVVSKKF